MSSGSRRYRVEELVGQLKGDYRLEGDPRGLWVDHVGAVFDADEHALVWVSAQRPDKRALIQQTGARVILCDPTTALEDGCPGKCLIKVENPQLAFARLALAIFAAPRVKAGIHPSAIVHPEAQIDPTAWIGPFCQIERCEVGAGSWLDGHITVNDRVRIGRNVFIKAGARLGGEGFGSLRNEQGIFEPFPHFGGLVIRDNVHIGCNVVIDRGTLGNTTVGEGSQINSLTLIGHNVQIGQHVLVGANCGIFGGSKVGDFTTIWNSSTVFDGLSIGSRVVVGAGSLVTRDVRDGAQIRGAPAREIIRH